MEQFVMVIDEVCCWSCMNSRNPKIMWHSARVQILGKLPLKVKTSFIWELSTVIYKWQVTAFHLKWLTFSHILVFIGRIGDNEKLKERKEKKLAKLEI